MAIALIQLTLLLNLILLFWFSLYILCPCHLPRSWRFKE